MKNKKMKEWNQRYYQTKVKIVAMKKIANMELSNKTEQIRGCQNLKALKLE